MKADVLYATIADFPNVHKIKGMQKHSLLLLFFIFCKKITKIRYDFGDLQFLEKLFPFNCCYRLLGDIPENAVYTRYACDDSVSDSAENAERNLRYGCSYCVNCIDCTDDNCPSHVTLAVLDTC